MVEFVEFIYMLIGCVVLVMNMSTTNQSNMRDSM